MWLRVHPKLYLAFLFLNVTTLACVSNVNKIVDLKSGFETRNCFPWVLLDRSTHWTWQTRQFKNIMYVYTSGPNRRSPALKI